MTKYPTNSLQNYRNSLKEYLKAFVAIQRSDAFINILATKVDTDFFKKLQLDKLLNSIVKIYPNNYLDNLFLVNLVTLLEVYLKDRLIEEIENNESVTTKFLKQYKTDRKINIDDVLKGSKILAKELLDEVIFHRLSKAEKIYKIVFDIDVKKIANFKLLNELIQLRHSITHEGAKEKSKKFRVNQNYLKACMNEVNVFIENIDYYISHKRKKKRNVNLILRLGEENSALVDMQDMIDYEIERSWKDL